VEAACGDTTLAWHEIGRGRPLVLVHGLADDHRAWRKTIPGLALDHRVILYDLRGHGESGVGRPDGTLAQLSADLIALMDAISLSSATIAGFSLGGTIAMRAALDHPQRVAGLALVSTSSRVGAAAQAWYQARSDLARAGGAELRATLDRDTEDVYRRQPAEIADGIMIRRQSTADPGGYANACRAMSRLHDEPLDPELPQISAPTVVLTGEDDQHCPPRAAQIIASGIPGSSLHILAATGHAAPVERPLDVVAAIRHLR
jgi:pimeloyl-ACP methyl ester carboxylesterase